MTFRSQLVVRSRWSVMISLSIAGVMSAPRTVRGLDPTVTPTPTPIVSACVGDCNDDGAVAVDDLLTMVSIAVGIADVSTCSVGDANGDGQITIEEILTAVNNALGSCPTPVPTATPLPGVTPVTHTVEVGPNGTFVFNPPTLTIHVGDTVQWTWKSSGHSVNSGSSDCVGDDQFCSPDDSDCAHAPLSNLDATYSHTFTVAGTYPYFCTPHCGFGMVGTITVQE
jgi:plastocyanin